MSEIATLDGELIEPTMSMAVQLQKGEIDQMISTAKAYPRSLQRVKQSILSMATLDEESAEECMYALPRGGKPIKGPSIRFAEILKQSYGNCRAAARVVHVDKAEGYVEAEGVFHDLETNSASTARVRRRILDKRGKVFSDDMIIVTGNAACSIAMRNAILNGVPKPLWRKAYDTVQATIAGDVTTLAENREKAIKAMATFGVKPDRIFEALGIAGEEEIAVDHIVTLRGMYSALKNGEATVEEMFAGTAPSKSDHQKVVNPLADEPQSSAKQEPASEQDETAPANDASEYDRAPQVSGDAEEGEPRFDAATADILTRYTADMLASAVGEGDEAIRLEAVKEGSTKLWAKELQSLSVDARKVSESVYKSARAIARDEADVSSAITFFAEQIGVEESALRRDA